MLAVMNGIFLALVAAWCWKRDAGLLHAFYWPALIVKCLAGVALGIIYSTYYDTSDTFTFFQWAAGQADLARNDIGAYLDFLFRKREGYFLGEHRTVFYIKITSVLALVTGNNYWLTSVYYSLLSFFAAWYLSNTIARFFPDYKISSCIAFLFFPSVVFWSSGVIKESLAMAAIFFLTALFLKLWMKDRISIVQLVLAVVSVIVIFNLKYYYLAVFIPVSGSSLAAKWLSDKAEIKRWSGQVLIWICMLILGFIVITFLHPNIAPSKILTVVVSNNKVFMNACTPDDVIHFHNLEPSWLSVLLNAPWAFVSGLFRPFIWEANTIFKFITGFEKLVILILTISALPLLKNMVRSPHRLLICAAILYSLTLSIFLALSTPNFGTLARYSAGFLPFVIVLIFNQPAITKLLLKLF